MDLLFETAGGAVAALYIWYDRLNIEVCALILALYATQWEGANPTWSIRDRPEILATLYPLGFQKSKPKADPQASRFGPRVREVYDGRWMREHFGSGPESQPSR